MHGLILVIVLLSSDGMTSTVQPQQPFGDMVACTTAKNNIINQITESQGGMHGSVVPMIVSQGCYPQSSFK